MEITFENMEDFAQGAAFLGTGGGGDPYYGRLLAQNAIREFGAPKVITTDDLDDDTAVFTAAMLGSPPVLMDNFESFTQDARFTSNADQKFRWMVGMSYLDRKVVNLLSVGGMLQGTERIEANLVRFLNRPDVRNDKAWGAYAQANYDITDNLELTAALRYDKNNFDTTQYTDLTFSTVVPAADGPLSQKATNDRWQPKVQLAYQWNDDVMTYITYSEGFRFGFYNTGNLTAPENTKNFEFGFKSMLADGRVRLNGAIFHIDYSNQQFTSIIATAPFRQTTNVPESNINGGELEIVALLAEGLELSGGLGITDSKIVGDARSPSTPDYSLNLALSYTTQITDDWEAFARVDYRRQGSFVLIDGGGTRFTIDHLLADSIVWDNHGCMPLRPGDDSFLPQLERYHSSGFDVVTLNVGFDGTVWQNSPRLLALFRGWIDRNSDKYRLGRTVSDIRQAK